MVAKYLFFDTELKKWVYGDDLKGIANPNTLKLDRTPNSEIFCFRDPANRDLIVPDSFPGTAANYKKKDGTPYANFEEFFEATKDFFVADVVASPTAAQITELSSVVGAKADEAATTDTGTFSLIALVKRVLQSLTSIYTRQGDGSQKTQIIDPSGVAILPNGKAIVLQKRVTRPNDVVQYSDNDAFNSSVAAPVSIVCDGMASANGRGGWLTQIEATSNITALAGKIIRVFFYSEEPAGLVGDNLQMISEDTNTQKGRHYIDIKFNSLVTNDTVVTGQKDAFWNYVCAAGDTKLYARIKLLNGFTPIANGWIHLTLTAIQQ